MRLGFALALIAALAVAQVKAQTQTAAASAAKRPVADFAALPFMAAPVISPNGNRVAAEVAIGGRQAFAILDLFDSTKKPIYIGFGESDLRSWSWVNDDWLAIELGAAVHAESEPVYISRVAGVRADGTKIVPIAFRDGGQSAHLIWHAHDGTPRILMSMQDSIYLGAGFWPNVSMITFPSASMRKVVNGSEGVMNWYADPAGAVRLGVGRDDERLTSRLLYRPDAGQSFHTIDRANLRQRDDLTLPILTADSARGYTISAPHKFAALYELTLPGLTIGKRVFGIDGYDIDDVTIAPDGVTVAGIAYTSDRPHMHWIDPALAEIQDQLDKAVAPRFADIVSLSRNQKRLIVKVGDASEPGSYYYYDAEEGGTMKRFAFVNNAIRGERMGPVSTYRYKARDGLSIEAMLTLPRGRDPKALALILMPHGGPDARDDAEYDWWAQFLADRGYAVVQPNYRGSTGYGHEFQSAGDGQWGLKMQDDLNDAVDDLAAKGTIDPKRVCILGASYGGYAALRAAQRDGARFRCAISYAGVSDLNGMIRYDGAFLNGNASRLGWQQSAPDLKDVSPINHADQFATPILIMHGKKDLRVPVSQSRRMVDRLKAAGKTVDYIEQPEGDHHFTRQADRLQFLEAIEGFLGKYNPAG